MANLKISQFTTLAASAQSPNYLLPLADSGVTNYAMSLNSIFSNIGANTTTGQVTSTTVSTALSATNLGIVVTRGDNKRTVQALISSDAIPAPQLKITGIIGSLEGDNINRITFTKTDNGGTQAPGSATLGTIEYSNTTAIAASSEVRSLQSSGGSGVVQTWYSTRRNTSSLVGIFGIDNWGTFRVSRNLGPFYSDVQLSDPSKLMVIGNVDALNDTSNVCLHILNATTFTNQLNLLLQAVAGQSTNLFECKTSANVKTLQITTAGVLSPGSAAGVDLATSALPFKDLYLAGSSATPGTNNFRITGTATAARVITLPDATCTLTASSSALTSGRLPFVTTGGLLADSANALLSTNGDMTLTYSTTDTGGTGLTVNRTANTTVNSTNTPLGLYVFYQSQVSAGVTDSGSRIGARYDIYAGASHSGTVTNFIGFEARAFIDSSSTATAVVSAAYGIKSAVFNSKAGAVITTGIGVYSDTTSSQTITTAYDYVGNNASARNYLAGTLGVGNDNTYGQLWVASQSTTRRTAAFRAAASQTVSILELLDSTNAVLTAFNSSGALATFAGMADGTNIAVGTTAGTKIGTATTQKIAFFNATPITQPSATGVTTGFTANASANTVFNESTWTGNVGTKAYTVSDIVAHLKNLGLIAAS